MGGQGAQIGFDDRQGPGGPQSLVAAEIKIPEHRQRVDGRGELRSRQLILKLAMPVVGRGLDALQPRASGPHAKARMGKDEMDTKRQTK